MESTMPQTTPERAARWPGGDSEAIKHLQAAGFTLNRDWTWTKPPDYQSTDRDIDAVVYLIEEWDFDGIRNDEAP